MHSKNCVITRHGRYRICVLVVTIGKLRIRQSVQDVGQVGLVGKLSHCRSVLDDE